MGPLALGAGLALLAVAPPLFAVNRCVTASGKVIYTDGSCEAVGARREREVTKEISVVPLPPGPARKPEAGKKPAAAAPAGPPFRKSPDAPVLRICYDPAEAREDVARDNVDRAIGAAVAMWNAGCNVIYDYRGLCAADVGRHDQPIDYKVWWASWDDSLRIKEDASRTFRDHAIAAASPRIGVALNRTISGALFLRYYERALVHEFGHVVGMGHSADPQDVMYPDAGAPQAPTQSDLKTCNKAVEQHFGVKPLLK